MDKPHKLKTFRVAIYTVPSVLEQRLGIAQVRRVVKTIRGYSLADAKRRAGIE